MKQYTWAASVAVLALSASTAAAQTGASAWAYDTNVRGVTFGSDCCEIADDCCTLGDDCGDGCGCGDSCGGLAGFSLAGLLGLEDSGLDVGGWTQLGYHTNNTPLSQSFGDVLAFNDVPDQINLQQQWFYIGREADGSNGLDIGFRADFMYGTDAQKTQAFGNPTGVFDEGWDNGEYGWAIPQLYGEVAMGDLSIIMGHFYTLIGYEVVTAPDNFFYSHAYTMFNTEPFTHTGVLATYSGFDAVTLYGGWTLGWDTGFDNLNSGNNFLGGLSTSLGEFVTFTYMTTYGNFGARDGGADDSYSHSILFDFALTDNLNYIFQSDYLRIDNEEDLISEDDFGINQYLILGINDVFSVGQRIEWWKDEGVSYYESTSGVNVRLLDNLVFRPEYRYDWSPGGDIDESTVGMDMILTY